MVGIPVNHVRICCAFKIYKWCITAYFFPCEKLSNMSETRYCLANHICAVTGIGIVVHNAHCIATHFQSGLIIAVSLSIFASTIRCYIETWKIYETTRRTEEHFKHKKREFQTEYHHPVVQNHTEIHKHTMLGRCKSISRGTRLDKKRYEEGRPHQEDMVPCPQLRRGTSPSTGCV